MNTLQRAAAWLKGLCAPKPALPEPERIRRQDALRLARYAIVRNDFAGLWLAVLRRPDGQLLYLRDDPFGREITCYDEYGINHATFHASVADAEHLCWRHLTQATARQHVVVHEIGELI